MGKYSKQFSRMVGFRLSWDEADKLETLARQTGLTKSTVVRALVQQATVEALGIPAAPDPEEAPVTEQVGDRLQLSVYTILDYLHHRHPKSGKLRSVKVGKQWRIRERDLREFIEKTLVNGERRADLKPPTPHPVLVPPDRQPDRKAVMRPRLQAMRAQGMSNRAIARQLNAEGEPTPRGGRWHHTAVADLLAQG
jgi:excisionase family DNA binding protein